MKKAIILIFISIYTCATYAQQQGKHLKRANKYFERAFYSQAIPLYEKALKEEYSFEALNKIADAYFYTNNLEKANGYYRLLLKFYKKRTTQLIHTRYATTLKAKNKHKTAYKILRSYYEKNNPKKLDSLNKTIHYLENVKAMGERYHIENLAINTSGSEFGATLYEDQLVFAAPKKQKDGTNKTYGWTGSNYLDLYKVPTDKIHLGDSIAIPLSQNINSKLHEANIIFTKDGKTAYFTRNNFVKGKRLKDKKNITHVQIFKAQLIEGTWKNITPLPFNNTNYSTEHPALSPDEKKLYFASDMPNGFGSFDLYYVDILANGNYGVPKNLGATINTSKKEQFPFISQNNKLYFASNGHPGFGSLDVFISSIKEDTYTKPDNLGLPINSGYDDFSFIINSKKQGYFSSNRTSGKGNDDIYRIKELKPLLIEECNQFILGIISDIDTKKPLKGALVTLENSQNELLAKSITNIEGRFLFDVKCDQQYIVKASKDKYSKEQRRLTLKKERKKNNDASMELKSLLQLEREKKEAIALQQRKEHELREKKALELIAEKKLKIKKTIAKEKNLVADKKQTVIKTEEINFDYNLWYLRRDAKKAIQVVIDLMKKYPEMIVEIGTHSDMRGHKKYNQELSQKRANSVRFYLIDQGIEGGRVTAVGYGESKPIIKCKTEEACSEEQHEINRRCEFVVKRVY